VAEKTEKTTEEARASAPEMKFMQSVKHRPKFSLTNNQEGKSDEESSKNKSNDD